MRPCKDGAAVSNLAIDHCCAPALDVQLLFLAVIAGQNLHAAVAVLGRIDKDSPAIKVRPKAIPSSSSSSSPLFPARILWW